MVDLRTVTKGREQEVRKTFREIGIAVRSGKTVEQALKARKITSSKFYRWIKEYNLTWNRVNPWQAKRAPVRSTRKNFRRLVSRTH